jgi:molybdopterin-guanine dinucleotide biosynthesis protein
VMQILGKVGGKASGKTRRAKAMRRRKLQRIRSHAARMRWSKRVHHDYRWHHTAERIIGITVAIIGSRVA